ncbi:hypothetical protein IEQ34_006087 [Dendrobium chrysotoxum]|uniref:60S ribosomal export protein NMD3 n=1 Tax=Dendrobium chrysotoxum TaxID=161865 RepID=A0AAV7HD31_DENCH|nr:hypothetical protein IEQ34_006087 [Dendrobium chrysotoxum]
MRTNECTDLEVVRSWTFLPVDIDQIWEGMATCYRFAAAISDATLFQKLIKIFHRKFLIIFDRKFYDTCRSYLQPPRTWIRAMQESKGLLTFYLHHLMPLTCHVRIINVDFVWIEPHSKHIKLRLRI